MISIADSTHLQGAKIALLCERDLVTYLRDDSVRIPDPAQWDLPGGVCEPGETALACALRETHEEFGIFVPPEAVLYSATYTAQKPHREVAFFVARIPRALINAIVYGNEGQEWRLMAVSEFLILTDAVAELQISLGRYWRAKDSQ